MPWLRVEDAFPNHPKVHTAGEALGPTGRGRVLAVWLLGATYAVKHLTDGFLPPGVLNDPRYDPCPGDVVAAMVSAGLLEVVPGGHKLHDFDHYNPSAKELKDKKKADLERKRDYRAAHRPQNVRAESERNPNGIRSDNSALAGARGRARSETDTHTDTEEDLGGANGHRGSERIGAPATVSPARVHEGIAHVLPTVQPEPLINGREMRRHGQHAFCGRLCVTYAQHDDFVKRLGGKADEARAHLKAWYPIHLSKFKDQKIGDAMFEFWNNGFAEWVGTVTDKPKQSRGPVTPTREESKKFLRETGYRA